MKYANAYLIIKNCLDSLEEYEQLPPKSKDLLLRLMDDLHYDKRKIQKSSLERFQKVFDHLFEK